MVTLPEIEVCLTPAILYSTLNLGHARLCLPPQALLMLLVNLPVSSRAGYSYMGLVLKNICFDFLPLRPLDIN